MTLTVEEQDMILKGHGLCSVSSNIRGTDVSQLKFDSHTCPLPLLKRLQVSYDEWHLISKQFTRRLFLQAPKKKPSTQRSPLAQKAAGPDASATPAIEAVPEAHGRLPHDQAPPQMEPASTLVSIPNRYMKEWYHMCP